MGRALGLDGDVIVFGSLICRASGPEVCATAEPQTKKSKKERQVLRRDFIAISFLVRIGQAFRLDSQAGGIVHLGVFLCEPFWPTVMALAGHVSRAMMERYSHIRMEAKRRAVDDLSGIEFEPGWAQNRAQFFLSKKQDEVKSLKTIGEPGRTRTSNPLIKSQLLYH